jgi:outer membrane protein assembly factor BamB
MSRLIQTDLGRQDSHLTVPDLDTTTGKIAWTVRDEKSLARSGVGVAGDLVFFGDSGALHAMTISPSSSVPTGSF